MPRQFTAIIEKERDAYFSMCAELDVASQGDSIRHALSNLHEALELFFETASPDETGTRLHEGVFMTRVEVAVG